jgi:GNAT superfamily N-acetyltransferase
MRTGVGFATAGAVAQEIVVWVGRVARLLRYLASVLPSALYCRQQQYITVKRLGAPSPSRPPMRPDIDCLIVDSVATLQAVGWEIPETFRDSVMELGKRVNRGCVVCLARRKRDDGDGHEVVGYELSEPGVFSAMGRRIAVADGIVFSHYAEVLPEYRGQRIHGLMFATRDAYYRQRGGRIICGVCLPDNHASLRALRRDGAEVVGTVERASILRGRFVWDTPADRIDKLLRAVSVGRGPRSGRPARAFRSTAA